MSVTVCILYRYMILYRPPVRIVHQVSAGIDLPVAPEIEVFRGFSGRIAVEQWGFPSIWGYQFTMEKNMYVSHMNSRLIMTMCFDPVL